MRFLAILAFLLAVPAAAQAAPVVDGTFDISGMPGRISTGPDGNAWFVLTSSDDSKEFGRITANGAVTEYDTPGDVSVTDITAGDGDTLWLARAGGVVEWDIGDETGTDHSVPEIQSAQGIARDAGGFLWVVDDGNPAGVVKVRPDGTAAEDDIQFAGSSGRDIAAGPDGRMWWVDRSVNGIRATPTNATDGTTTQTFDGGNQGQDVAISPSGFVAYTLQLNQPYSIGRVASGTKLANVFPPNGSEPFGITYGPDGAFWIALTTAESIVRMDEAGNFTPLPLGTPANSFPRRITPGPNNTLWVTLEQAKKIARISGVTAPVPPATGGGTAPGGGGGGGTTTPTTGPITSGDTNAGPLLTNATLSRTRFRVGTQPTALNAQRRRSPTPTGTTIRFRVDKAARVMITVERRRSGRRRGGRCLRPSRSNRRGRRCVRWVRQGTLRRTVQPGAVSIAFSGRLGRRPLPAGRHRFRISSTDLLGRPGTQRTLAFTVVR